MSDLTQEKRNELIKRLSVVLIRLGQSPDGPPRDDLKAELRELVRLLWMDGKPE